MRNLVRWVSARSLFERWPGEKTLAAAGFGWGPLRIKESERVCGNLRPCDAGKCCHIAVFDIGGCEDAERRQPAEDVLRVVVLRGSKKTDRGQNVVNYVPGRRFDGSLGVSEGIDPYLTDCELVKWKKRDVAAFTPRVVVPQLGALLQEGDEIGGEIERVCGHGRVTEHKAARSGTWVSPQGAV